MKTRITTLVDNLLGDFPGLKSEHGLSFLIEREDLPGGALLFDTGQGRSFLDNAKLLGVDLKRVQKVILSHGHFDHSGGLKDFVQTQGANFELIVGQGFFTPKYALEQGKWRFLGNNFDRQYLEHNAIKVTELRKDLTEIAPGVYVLTNFPRRIPFERPSPRFYTESGGEYVQDLFQDEVVVVLEVQQGLVVVLGCSHPGMVNILQTVRDRLERPLYCVIGGTHLMEAGERRLDETIRYLQDLQLPRLGVSHCTGELATKRLSEVLEQFFVNSTGTRLSFD